MAKSANYKRIHQTLAQIATENAGLLP